MSSRRKLGKLRRLEAKSRRKALRGATAEPRLSRGEELVALLTAVEKSRAEEILARVPSGGNLSHLSFAERHELQRICETARRRGGTPAVLRMHEERMPAEVRQGLAAAGLPAVADFNELSAEQVETFCRYHGLDEDGCQLDLPCYSWQVKDHLVQCSYWHGKVERGEMPREEYHRLVLELAGLPPEEPSSSGQPEETPSSAGG
jgi:hypothetical protein